MNFETLINLVRNRINSLLPPKVFFVTTSDRSNTRVSSELEQFQARSRAGRTDIRNEDVIVVDIDEINRCESAISAVLRSKGQKDDTSET